MDPTRSDNEFPDEDSPQPTRDALTSDHAPTSEWDGDELVEGPPQSSSDETFLTSQHASGSKPIASVSRESECEFETGSQIGRYIVINVLGTGGFGHVLLANDPSLNRKVAIKVPRRDRLGSHRERFFEEGRAVARLKHPSIISVYDIEETTDGLPFAVLEYVEGSTLQEVIRDEGMTFHDSVNYLIQIGEALAYAHSKTLIHRDLKPANVIIDREENRAKLMDFGLALHDLTPEENFSHNPEGTPPYMAPEQVRGENHRLDRRTDIWGVGVIMFILLTGRRPFKSDDVYELLQDICLKQPPTPIELNPDVPAELSRICMKCLQKLMSHRYSQSNELVEDLKAFRLKWNSETDIVPDLLTSGIMPTVAGQINHTSQRPTLDSFMAGRSTTGEVKVVPKGLRSFDTQDADFFLDLLPGPKDRDGIPESIRFWLGKIKGDKLAPMPVGLIFGPSGCGKSSFVKAGLIPRLPAETKTIYVEAAPDQTENRIFSQLKAIAPQVIRDETRLPIIFNRIRRGQLMTGEKTMIVIDQFEQWLHSNTELTDQPLIEALRQCDGENLICLLLVRDDFWLSATHFMSHLDMKVQEGVNALAIPLFDRRHARKVLTAYGRASEALGSMPSATEKKFVNEAVNEMSQNDRVIPVHLALFSQMLDADSWTSSELKRMGGWQGIGVRFLEKIFSDKRRQGLEPACRQILRELLPQSNMQIKGGQTSRSQLADKLAKLEEEKQLEPALELLDRELRVITATETETGDDVVNYQLSHDYLVNPIRRWLRKKETQTWQGRARLQFSDLASQWAQSEDSRFFPGTTEFGSMLLAVDRKTLNSNEKKFFSGATKILAIRSMIVITLLTAMLSAFLWIRSADNDKVAKQYFQTMLDAPPQALTARWEFMQRISATRLKKLLASPPKELDQRAQWNLLLTRAEFTEPGNLPHKLLLEQIAHVTPDYCDNLIAAISKAANGPQRESILTSLRQPVTSANEQFRRAVVAFHLGDNEAINRFLSFKKDGQIRESFIDQFSNWHGPLPRWIHIARSIDDPEIASGILKCLGNTPQTHFSTENQSLLKSAAIDLFGNDKSGPVHSCAEWILRTFDHEIPTLQRTNRRLDGEWFVSPKDRLTFVEIHPAAWQAEEKADQRILNHSFHMATKEVSAKLFLDFVLSLNPEHPTRVYFTEKFDLAALVGSDLPATNVSWAEAVAFCNWLSRRHGFTPCYNVDEDISGDEPITHWTMAVDGTGYRLCAEHEWNAANTMGRNTQFFFGDDDKNLARYVSRGARKTYKIMPSSVQPRGKKMPNDFGVFDMLGNAGEWCDFDCGIYKANHSGDRNRRISLGGTADDSIKWYKSGESIEYNLSARYDSGIRLMLN